MHIFRIVPFSALALLTACTQQETTTACAGDEIIASNAWVRAAGEGSPMSAAYVELCNGGDTADRLIAARFDDAGAAEVHVTRMSEDGVASMAPAEGGLELPAHEKTELAPGGAHIMLIGLTGPLEEGEEAALTLEFENAEPLNLMFEVRSRVDAAGHSNH